MLNNLKIARINKTKCLNRIKIKIFFHWNIIKFIHLFIYLYYVIKYYKKYIKITNDKMFVESLLFLANDEEIKTIDRLYLKYILKDCEKDP